MKIPYYIIRDAPVSEPDPALANWVRDNGDIIRLVATDIRKRIVVGRTTNGKPGRPGINREDYVDVIRDMLAREGAAPQRSVIEKMAKHRPVSETSCRVILRQLAMDGLIRMDRGEFPWSPITVSWTGESLAQTNITPTPA